MDKNKKEKFHEPPSDIIYGRNPVIETLKSGTPVDSIFISGNGGSLNVIRSVAKEKGIPIKDAGNEKLNKMTNRASHQGVVAVIACGEYVTVDDILEISKKKGTKPFIIICDSIEDPHNLGAIIRTAETAGADGIIIPKRRSAGLNSTVYKTSAGAVSYVPVARVSNLSSAIDKLKENGVWIYGTDSSGSDCYSTDLTGSCGLVIGSEGFGISRLTREKCDCMIRLPMYGSINSLNASVAGGIFMYEIIRQRRFSGNLTKGENNG